MFCAYFNIFRIFCFTAFCRVLDSDYIIIARCVGLVLFDCCAISRTALRNSLLARTKLQTTQFPHLPGQASLLTRDPAELKRRWADAED